MMDIHAKAYRGELADTLTVAELALLRASSFSGRDEPLFQRLILDIQGRIDAGFILPNAVDVHEWTGAWEVTRPHDLYRDSKLDEREFITDIAVSTDPKGPARPPGGSIKKQMRTRTETLLTKHCAQQLYKQDPSNWSDASLKWAETEFVAVVAVKAEQACAAVVEACALEKPRVIAFKMDDAHNPRRGTDAMLICELASLAPMLAIAPAKLYQAIAPTMKEWGYEGKQIERVKKEPQDLPPSCRADYAKHLPYEVVLYILTNITPDGPAKRARPLAVAPTRTA